MSTQEIITKERCYKCGGELEDGFIEVPGEDGPDYVCSKCAGVVPVSVGWDEYDEADMRFTERYEEGEN